MQNQEQSEDVLHGSQFQASMVQNVYFPLIKPAINLCRVRLAINAALAVFCGCLQMSATAIHTISTIREAPSKFHHCREPAALDIKRLSAMIKRTVIRRKFRISASMEIICIQTGTLGCHLLIKKAETDTFLDVRVVACKGGQRSSVTEKDRLLVKAGSSLTSAWYL